MGKFIALATLQLPHPEGNREFTGAYDGNGNPLTRHKLLIIKPGETVEIDDPKIVASLQRQKAIISPEEQAKFEAACEAAAKQSIAQRSHKPMNPQIGDFIGSSDPLELLR